MAARSREDEESMVGLALAFFMDGFLGLPQEESMDDLHAEYRRVMAAYRWSGMSMDESFHAANADLWRALEAASARSPGDSEEEERFIRDVKAIIAEQSP